MNAMKDFWHTPNIVGLNYDDLGRHPYLALPGGFKVPKFDTISGTENPLTRLRAYCEQNKLITQLLQEILEMKDEMDKTRDLTNLTVIANTPTLENDRPPLHFPISDPTCDLFSNYSTTSTIQKHSIIDSTTPNSQLASSSHQKSPTSQNLDTNILQKFPLNHQIPTQIVQNHLPLNPNL